MKRALLLGLLLIGASALGGCPIYPEDRVACASSSDCPYGYACDYSAGYCYQIPVDNPNPKSCAKPSDCGDNETCGKTGHCGIGDCTFHGCVSGYTCDVADGVWTCVATSSTGGAGGGGGTAGSSGAAGAGGTAGAAGAAGSPADASLGGSAGAASGGSAGADAGTD